MYTNKNIQAVVNPGKIHPVLTLIFSLEAKQTPQPLNVKEIYSKTKTDCLSPVDRVN